MHNEVKAANIVIQQGIPEGQERAAARIYHMAFERKLRPILSDSLDQVTDILSASLNPQNAIVALRDGQVVGLLGFHHSGKPMVDVTFGALVQHFGLLRALWKALLGILLMRKPQPGELLMDGIAVDESARGQGIGTRLFDALFAFAAANDYTYIRLDVINTNPRAQQLYERLGFVAVKTERVPFMQFMGFTAVTEMRLDLSS